MDPQLLRSPATVADYGYDAPYALKAFATLGAGSVVAAIVARWRQNSHLAAMLGFYGAFFLANAASFFYTTRRGKFQVWDEVVCLTEQTRMARALRIVSGPHL